jgi:hypothetical protein
MTDKTDTTQYPVETTTAVCRNCQSTFQAVLKGRYYEGTCTCGQRWQMPKSEIPMRSEKQAAYDDLVSELEGLYIKFWFEGHQPGLLDARTAWSNIMTKYERLRKVS